MSGSLNATLMRGFSGVFTSRLGFDRGAIVIKRKEEKDKVRRARGRVKRDEGQAWDGVMGQS